MAKYLVDVVSNTVNTYEVEADTPAEATSRYADIGIIVHSESTGPLIQDVNQA